MQQVGYSFGYLTSTPMLGRCLRSRARVHLLQQYYSEFANCKQTRYGYIFTSNQCFHSQSVTLLNKSLSCQQQNSQISENSDVPNHKSFVQEDDTYKIEELYSDEDLLELMEKVGMDSERTIVLRMLASQRGINQLIGEGGNRLKSLCQICNCVIRFSNTTDRYPGNTRRIMEIRGKCLSVFKALSTILPTFYAMQLLDKQRNADSRLSTKFKDKFFAMPFFNVELAGSIIGKGGATLFEIQQSTNTFVQGENSETVIPGCYNRIFWIRGTPQEVLHAIMQITVLIYKTESYKYFMDSALTEHTEIGWLPNFLRQIRQEEYFKSEDVVSKLSIETKYMDKIQANKENIEKSTQCSINIDRKDNVALVAVSGAFLNSMRAKGQIALIIKQQKLAANELQKRKTLQRPQQ
eukprot:TRINITY_DN16272_c0_g4_i3.p1 TRINITY_DN16272_c0_g4~~TRINITY_DN16272_c0_g4_i3.p1  ORF type:complete len:408 (-),score=28.99 TRINITY_DN16272_c0_g4_i3:209-1432(-)